MTWLPELSVVGALCVIFVMGVMVLSAKRETILGKVFTLSVVSLVICSLVYVVSLNQFHDGTVAFQMLFKWFETGVKIAQVFFAPLVA